MATTINADTVTGGAIVTGDASGQLELQAAGNTGLTINSSRALGVGASPSYGTSGQVLTSAGSAAAPTWTTPSTANVQTFTSSGTWTKPSGANFVMVEAWGAGGGGGSGRKNSGTTVNYGGGGGGGGAYTYRLFKASDLSATETITIGAGGSGGASQTTNSADGNAGTVGGNTSFGTKLYAFGGNGGTGGSNAAVAGGVGGGVLSSGALGGLPNTGATNGQFGTGTASSTNAGASGFAGGPGGGSRGGGGLSYQGGPGGGGGGGVGNTFVDPSGEGGGIIAKGSNTYGNGALAVVYPGASGNNGSGRQGASGGAGGYAESISITRYGITYGNSTFALLENSSGLISKSANGTTGWARVAGPSNTNIAAIMHDGTQFVLIGPGAVNVWTTTDFSTYTQKTGFGSNLSYSVTSCKYLNGKYFVWGTSLYYSSDLVTWTLASTGNGSAVTDIAWSGTNYVAISGTSPRTRYSSNLTSWSSSTGADTANNLAVTSNGSGTVVIAVNNGSIVYSTDNGVTFSAAATAVTVGANGATLSYLNSTYILACNTTAINTSTDGTNWTLRTGTGAGTSTGGGLGGAAWDGTTYVLGQAITSGSVIIAQTSTDLVTWTDRTVTTIDGAGGTGGTGGQPGGGGGGGGSSTNTGGNSGAGGTGGAGQIIVYTW